MSASMDRKVERPRPPPRVLIALIVVTALGAAWLTLGPSLTARSVRVPADTVTISQAQDGVFHDLTPFNGKVTPHDVVDLDTLEGGQVDKVLVNAGDTVAAGQPLVAFRNTELELDVLDREGRLIESVTELQSYEKQLEDTRLASGKAEAEANENIARLSLGVERRVGLAAKGEVSAEALDAMQKELTYNRTLLALELSSDQRETRMRQEQLPQIRSQIAALRQDLKVTRSKLDDLTVKAPVAGLLTDFDLNIGQNFNRGDRLGRIVLKTGFKVAAQIDEYYLGRVSVGQVAAAQFDGQDWKLKVTRVYPQVSGGTFRVDLDFVDGRAPADLLAGQTVTGRLLLGNDHPALILPAGPFLERSGGDWVMVMVGDRQAERRRIKIGRRSAEQVEVLSGLSRGDRVITSDYSAFEKVDRVDLTN